MNFTQGLGSLNAVGSLSHPNSNEVLIITSSAVGEEIETIGDVAQILIDTEGRITAPGHRFLCTLRLGPVYSLCCSDAPGWRFSALPLTALLWILLNFRGRHRPRIQRPIPVFNMVPVRE